MARLWRNNPETKEGKYLVTRRDGTVVDFAHFVLGERDPAAPDALRAYAAAGERLGYDPEFVADVRELAADWERNLALGVTTKGDADAPRHRVDDPETIAKMRKAKGS